MQETSGKILLSSRNGQWRRAARTALRAAWPASVPVLAGYWILGFGYGLYTQGLGLPLVWPMLMAAVVYSGSVEFLLASMLLGAFRPWETLAMALVVGARHLFYGLSMLARFQDFGWKKPFVVFWMADEAFAVEWSATLPPGVDYGWFCLWVSGLNWFWWQTGVCMGWLAAGAISVDLAGIGFVMTAMFVAIFAEQWAKDRGRGHASSLLGLAMGSACLAILGPDAFLIPSLLAILACLAVVRFAKNRSSRRDGTL